jgi:hypothetical protein
VVNVANPYRSIVQRVKLDQGDIDYAANWLKIDKQDILEARTIEEVERLFLPVAGSSKNIPIIGYYNAKTDISWCNFRHTAVDMCKAMSEIAARAGTFRSNSESVKLGDIYSALVMPIHLEYGREHTSLTDALYLYGLLHGGHLPRDFIANFAVNSEEKEEELLSFE